MISILRLAVTTLFLSASASLSLGEPIPEGTVTKDKWQESIPAKAFNLKSAGRDSLKSGNAKAAIEKLTGAMQAKPDYYIGAFTLGLAYSKAGDKKGTETWYRKALNIAKQSNIKDASIYNSLGYFYWQEKKDSKKAKEYYQQGLKVDPKHGKLLNNYGVLLFGEGEYQKAAEILEQALAAGFQNAEKTLVKVMKLLKNIKVEKKQYQNR